jgi:hypothetical protein
MDGTSTTSQLVACEAERASSGIRFELATPAHDASLRRLLRDNPMSGSISVSLEREPSFFAAVALEGPNHQTIVGFEGDRFVGAGSISERQRFVNGQPMRVGYLGGLRLDKSFRGRFSWIRQGYEQFHKLHSAGGPPIYLTSIVADNLPARRFLEKGLRGMPTYRHLGDFVTLIIGHRSRLFRSSLAARHHVYAKGFRIMQGSNELRSDLLELLDRHNRAYQFAPAWSAAEIDCDKFSVVCSSDGAPVACAALWDQRTIKQSVVRGYSGHLLWSRHLINAAATCVGMPRLPRVGTPISYAFVSHMAAHADQPEFAECLIALLQEMACARGIDYLTFGLDSCDPRLAHLRKVFHPREYVSRIYAVYWEDGAVFAQSLDSRVLGPEVAIL